MQHGVKRLLNFSDFKSVLDWGWEEEKRVDEKRSQELALFLIRFHINKKEYNYLDGETSVSLSWSHLRNSMEFTIKPKQNNTWEFE